MQDRQRLDNTDLAADLVRELLKEKRRDRRWSKFRFFLVLCLIGLVLSLVFFGNDETRITGGSDGGYVALIRLSGMIAPEKDFSAEQVLPILRDAFADKQAKGVVLDINSGGGTPVQASIIHDAVLEMKKKYHKKVVVVGEDLLASGAYYVAVSADTIYVNPNTITGSIGVIMKGFGFTDLIKKLGIDRRVYTAGENKDRLDPFLPQNNDDITKIKAVIAEVHDNFTQAVIQGRKGRLHVENKDVFSGDFWSGQSALKLGLVDHLGNLTDVLQNEFHVTRYKDYSESRNVVKSLVNQLGTTLATTPLSNTQMGLSEHI